MHFVHSMIYLYLVELNANCIYVLIFLCVRHLILMRSVFLLLVKTVYVLKTREASRPTASSGTLCNP